MTKKTIKGPGGIRIELDSAEIFPDDPGQGTPAMVYLGGYSATYWCAADTGELDCGEKQLSITQCNWLHEVEDEVNAFVEDNAPGKA